MTKSLAQQAFDKIKKPRQRLRRNVGVTLAQKAWANVKMVSSESIKKEIQTTLRSISIKRDGGCVLRELAGKNGVPQCNGYRTDGELIYQYDHLNSRAHNVSYADTRLGVCVCKGHHGWKHYSANNKKMYDKIMREIIGEKRAKLWDKVEEDRKSYPMGAYEWGKVLIGLKDELKKLSTV